MSLSPVTDWFSERFDSNLGAWVQDFLGGATIERQEDYRDRSPVFLVERNRTPTLLTAGTRDRATPMGQARSSTERFVNTMFRRTSSCIHSKATASARSRAIFDLVTRTVGWFERFMPPDPAAR